MKTPKKMKFSTFLVFLSLPVFVIYLFFLFLFYHGSITWELFVASAVYALLMSAFIAICSLSPRVVLSLFAIGYLLFFGIYYYLGGDISNCLTADFCLERSSLFVTPALTTIGMIVVNFILIAGLRLGIIVNLKYPSARYYMGAGISFFFLLLIRLVYLRLGYEADFIQNILSVYLGLIGLFAVFVALNVSKLSERVKKIPVAAILSSILLLPILIPFKEENMADTHIVRIGFAIFAVFFFFFFLFYKKPEKSLEKKS